MHENQILDLIDSLTLNSLNHEDKSIILAHVKSEYSNNRLAGSLGSMVSEKIDEYEQGFYKEAQQIVSYFQDYSEKEKYPQPNEIINKSDIDKFLDKMSSKDFEGDLFNDSHEFYHPIENMKAEGVARHRSDFVVPSGR